MQSAEMLKYKLVKFKAFKSYRYVRITYWMTLVGSEHYRFDKLAFYNY